MILMATIRELLKGRGKDGVHKHIHSVWYNDASTLVFSGHCLCTVTKVSLTVRMHVVPMPVLRLDMKSCSGKSGTYTIPTETGKGDYVRGEA